MCRETSELGLGSLKDRLCIIEQLIVSKLVAHLLAEYTCGLQSLAEPVFFSSSSLPKLKYCTQIAGKPVAQIVPNICVSALESRHCCSM